MELFKKNRGSVSIFLVILLVPMLVVCSVFVDASRIKLAKSLVDSAADLTMTTALSYYDLELNDYYGLLASSQSEEEFFSHSQTYFEACLLSQGIHPNDAEQWAETLREIVEGESDITDLLQIEVAGEGYSLAPLADGNLANATVMKSDIVDFMKYRAPIELLSEGKSIIGKLQEIGEMQEIIPVETKLQDEKQEYYDAEHKLLKRCGEIYIDFNTYDAMALTAEKLSEIKAYLDGLWEEYHKLHTRLVMNLYNGEGKEAFSSVKSACSSVAGVNTGDKVFSADALRELLNACRSSVEKYDKSKAALEEKLASVPFAVWNSSYYDIQYWIQMDDSIGKEYANYIRDLKAMLKAKKEMENGFANREVREEEWEHVEYEVEDAVVDMSSYEAAMAGEGTHTETRYEKVQEAYDCADDEYSYDAGYATIRQSYEQVIQEEINPRSNALSSQQIYGISQKLEDISVAAIHNQEMSTEKVTEKLKEIAAQMEAYLLYLEGCKKILDDIYKGMDKLKKDMKTYEKEYEDWKGEAEGASAYFEKSDIVDTDLHEIGVIEKTEEPGMNEENLQQVKIDEKELEDCMARVNNVRSLIGTYIDSLKEFTYGGKQLRDIEKYKTLKDKSGIHKESIVLDEAALRAYVEASFAAVFVKPADTNYHNITDNNNPWFSVNKPAFYEWLHGQFDGKDLTDKDKSDSVLEKLKDKMEEEKNKNKEEPDRSDISENEVKDKENLPSGGSTTGPLNTGKDEELEEVDSVTNTTALFGEVDLKNILIAGRDNLYVTSYIMSMFSYDTFVKENKYEHARGEEAPEDIYKLGDGKTIGPANAAGIYNDYKDWWANEDMLFTANKTLTNKMLNGANNYAFGNEVEYILYGGKNDSNKLKSYGTIFGIRYAMNIGPVFSMYWNHKELVIPIATTISAATSGIIPVSLIKLVICLGMTAAETAVDISYLKAGLPVQFAKRDKDLFLQMNFEELAEGATELAGGLGINEKKGAPTGLVLSYSEYLTLFLYIAVCIGEEGIYKRVADVIQCNMQQRDEDFLMSKAVAYYEMKAHIAVKPLFLALPWSEQYGSNALEGSSWNTFTIRQIKGY